MNYLSTYRTVVCQRAALYNLFDEVVFFLFFHSCIYKFCLFVAYKYGFADQPPSNERQWFYVGEVVCPEWAMAIVGCRCPESKKPRANLTSSLVNYTTL